MLLQSLEIHNFRCFKKFGPVPMHRLTVVIGENDSGKTAIVDALKYLLTSDLPEKKDYRNVNNDENSKEDIVLKGEFLLEEYDELPDDFITSTGDMFVITKTISNGKVQVVVDGKGFNEIRWNNFDKQSAGVQRELLQSIGVAPGSNAEKRVEQFVNAVESHLLQKLPSSLEVPFNEILDYLPRFELTASSAYRDPDLMVQQTLRSVVGGFLKPENPETGERVLLPELEELSNKIKDVLDDEVRSIKSILQQAHPNLVDIQVSPIVDFSRSLTSTNLMIDVGDGLRLINAFGEGTKKKLWMGLLDWQRLIQQTLKDIPVIRAYDEPDVNLDYTAERKLFDNILESTRSSRTQAIVCTHALTLVDRAPGKAINLISVNDDGSRSITHLDSDDDPDVKEFLSTIGRSIGITNSAIFYERSFLVVEGESEENALPILYRNLYGHSMVEDGISLVPLFTSGAWKSVLRVLQRNKADITIMLLDSDCTSANSCARLSPDVLVEIGYPENYFSQKCYLIGDKEFEDAFSTTDIIDILNSYWPKSNGDLWVDDEVDQFRTPGCKFSEDLLNYVRRQCTPKLRNTAKKPEFAEKLANHCLKDDQIPSVIIDVFSTLRTISGCLNSQ